MFISYYIIVFYLLKHVTVMKIQSKKVNIKGKQVEHPQSFGNVYDYKKYYKDLFQPMDIHPQLYGNKVNKTKSNTVRENINDDVEHDKYTLIFQQVYNFYKKMLNKRKSESNSKLDKLIHSKNKLNSHVNLLEKAMKYKMDRFEHVNHKRIVKDRNQQIKEEKNSTHDLNPKLSRKNNSPQDHPKGIDTIKIKSILHDVENFVQKKVTNEFNTKQADVEAHEKEHSKVENQSEVGNEIKNDFKQELGGKIKNFFGFGKGSSVRSTRKITKTKKTTTSRPTTPDLVQWALNHTDTDDSFFQIPTCKGNKQNQVFYPVLSVKIIVWSL